MHLYWIKVKIKSQDYLPLGFNKDISLWKRLNAIIVRNCSERVSNNSMIMFTLSTLYSSSKYGLIANTGLPFSPLKKVIILLFHMVNQSFFDLLNFMIATGATNLSLQINVWSKSIEFVKVEAVGMRISAIEPLRLCKYSSDGAM